MQIEVSGDSLDELVRVTLVEAYGWLNQDYKKRKKGKGTPFYNVDPKTDAKIYKQKMKAFDEVIEYYSTLEEYAEFEARFK